MKPELEGTYLDGQTALRHHVRVSMTPKGLIISVEGGGNFSWPWEEIRQPQNFYGDKQVRLERGGNIPEVVLVPGLLFLEKLNEVAPERRRIFRKPARGRGWAKLALLSGPGVIGLTAALYLWGIPAMASLAAAHIPVSWEERLGQSVIEQLAPPEKQCFDSARARRVEEVLTALTSSIPESPYTFRVKVVNHSAVNAFAVPGGTIVIFRGLIERTRSAEELAGILAHEVQHILRRHGTRSLLQHTSLRLILATVAGDARAFSYGLEGAQVVAMLRYNRRYEEEADEEGVRLLKASAIDPRGMISFFVSIQKEGEKSLRIPTYLSTHPDLNDRIQRLKSLMGKPGAPSIKLLPDYNWNDMYGFCGSVTPPH